MLESIPQNGASYPRSTHTSWSTLPPEIQAMVLDQLVVSSNSSRYKQATLASVCRKWQVFFERSTFKSLYLKPWKCSSDLDAFNSIVQGHRRQLVQKITIEVRLALYRCKYCDKEESRDQMTTNSIRFTKAIWELLSILSHWEITCNQSTVSLEIKSGSPSDNKHSFPDEISLSSYRQHTYSSVNRRISPGGSRKRLLGNLLDIISDPGTELPKVSIVRSLRIDGILYRSLSAAALKSILKSLVKLRFVRYEPWQAVDFEGQLLRDNANIALFQNLRSSTCYVYLWEAPSAVLHDAENKAKRPNASLTIAAVEASYKFQALIISQAIDGAEFFGHSALSESAGPKSWPNLRFLALTCRHLALSCTQSSTDRLLLEAAHAAMRMPQLEAMELWCGQVSGGYIFRYHVKQHQTIITVITTKEVKLGAVVLEAWRRVAYDNTRQELQHNSVVLEATSLASRTSICKHLWLPRLLR